MAKKRILIVDDQQGVRWLLIEILGREKYTLLEAGSGEEALEVLALQPVDLVFLDVKLPQLDGVTTLTEITEMPDPPPVVVMTAQAQVGLKERAMSLGAAAYLEKPFALDNVLQLVEELT